MICSAGEMESQKRPWTSLRWCCLQCCKSRSGGNGGKRERGARETRIGTAVNESEMQSRKGTATSGSTSGVVVDLGPFYSAIAKV